MQIFVDADACPVVGIVEEIAEKYNIPTTLLCDTNHILYSDYSEVSLNNKVTSKWSLVTAECSL